MVFGFEKRLLTWFSRRFLIGTIGLDDIAPRPVSRIDLTPLVIEL